MAGGKRKRRRRKDGKSKSPAAPRADAASVERPSPPKPSLDDGELPDFDLDEDVEPVAPVAKAAPPAPAAKAAPSGGADVSVLSAEGVDLEDPRVLEAMRGSKSTTGPKTMDQLLRDRSLEKSFKFDPVGDDALPTLGEIASKTSSGSGVESSGGVSQDTKVGKKRARAEARRAAAIEAEEEAKEEGGLLSGVPMFVGEDGKVSPLKILEAGTWAGIAALVLWEVYLNSPLFERAAPMAPVVYQLWM